MLATAINMPNNIFTYDHTFKKNHKKHLNICISSIFKPLVKEV